MLLRLLFTDINSPIVRSYHTFLLSNLNAQALNYFRRVKDNEKQQHIRQRQSSKKSEATSLFFKEDLIEKRRN